MRRRCAARLAGAAAGVRWLGLEGGLCRTAALLCAQVLHPCSGAALPGECLALLGPSGAGVLPRDRACLAVGACKHGRERAASAVMAVHSSGGLTVQVPAYQCVCRVSRACGHSRQRCAHSCRWISRRGATKQTEAAAALQARRRSCASLCDCGHAKQTPGLGARGKAELRAGRQASRRCWTSCRCARPAARSPARCPCPALSGAARSARAPLKQACLGGARLALATRAGRIGAARASLRVGRARRTRGGAAARRPRAG